MASFSTTYDEKQTPLEPLRAALKAHHADPVKEHCQPVVLIGTGSMNPIHKMHIAMFDIAAMYLEKHCGMHVLAAYLSPSCDKYVKSKLCSKAISIEHRAVMCRLAADEHNRGDPAAVPILVDLWEAQQPHFIDFPAVRDRLQSVVSAAFPDDNILVFYVCGVDLYNRCRLRRLDRVVAVARPPYTPDPNPSTAEHNVIADSATDEQVRQLTCDCSSTEVRRRHNAGEPLTDLLFPSVLDYLENTLGWLSSSQDSSATTITPKSRCF